MGGIVDIIKMGLKFILFALLLASVGTFLSYLLGKIPPLSLSGCMGFYINKLGLFDGVRIFISILVYGFTAKFAIGYFKGYLN